MKILHKDADYSVRTLLFLAMRENSGYISATALANELGIPLHYLRRICSTLIKAEILASMEGAKGGVRLRRSPEEITVLELIELFHGRPEISECTFRNQLCRNRATCPLRRRILGIEEKISDEFAAINIQTLIDDVRK